MTIVIWNFEKWKKQKLKKSVFDSPLILNQTFSLTQFIVGKSDFPHYYAFLLNQMSDISEVWKHFSLKDGFHLIPQKSYSYFVVCGPKNFKLLPNISFDSGFKMILEFTAVFVYLLLSWSRRYPVKWNSNLDGLWFQQ